MGAGGPWTPWAAGEGGWTSRVNALLSTAKAAVGSDSGQNYKDDRNGVSNHDKELTGNER